MHLLCRINRSEIECMNKFMRERCFKTGPIDFDAPVLPHAYIETNEMLTLEMSILYCLSPLHALKRRREQQCIRPNPLHHHVAPPQGFPCCVSGAFSVELERRYYIRRSNRGRCIRLMPSDFPNLHGVSYLRWQHLAMPSAQFSAA